MGGARRNGGMARLLCEKHSRTALSQEGPTADSGLRQFKRRYVYYTTVLQGIKGKERKWLAISPGWTIKGCGVDARKQGRAGMHALFTLSSGFIRKFLLYLICIK